MGQVSRRLPRARSLADLEARLGHAFRNSTVLEEALTHVSAVTGEDMRTRSYQRLEFLGDRVLGLAVASMLHQAFAGADEGELSRRLAQLVRRETCAAVAEDLALGPLLRLGESEAHSGGRRKPALLADVCEAVIGAVFVDGGFPAALAVVEKFWRPRMEAPSLVLCDAKTALQEWAQARGLRAPTYREVRRTGPDHDPLFCMVVDVEAQAPVEGVGRSKRLAEQAAATAFLRSHGVWSEAAHATSA